MIDVYMIKVLVFQVETFSDEDGSKNSHEFEHETEEVANIKREIVWEWDSVIERRDLQLSENHDGTSIFVKGELSAKNEYDDGKYTINDEVMMATMMNKDPLEMKNDFSAASKPYPRKDRRKHSTEKPFKCDQCNVITALLSSRT